MAENSGIGWTHHTKNFWWGCDKVTAECTRCYIEGIMKRAGVEKPFGGPIRLKGFYKGTRRWNRQAVEQQTRFRIFTCSMSDFFHPGADAWRDEAWAVIREASNLDWLILTKRPELVLDRLPADWNDGWDHVWLGVTVGHEAQSYHRLDQLKNLPAKLRWISAEPLLTDVNFGAHMEWIDWMVTGCEQAAKEKRVKMDMDWVRNIDRQCRDYGVPHYFKQYYKTENGEEVGTPVTDGLLDGVKVQNFPESPAPIPKAA